MVNEQFYITVEHETTLGNQSIEDLDLWCEELER
jgi:hypothetical protein